MLKRILSAILLIFILSTVISTPIIVVDKAFNYEVEMKRFPSYDWSSEDNRLLAAVAANTPGTDRVKQEAIIEILTYVWDNSVSIPTAVNEFYTICIEPTEYDMNLVWMVIEGKWSNGEYD